MAEIRSGQNPGTGGAEHTLRLDGRTALTVSGVLSLDDYNETSVCAETSAGKLYIEGEGLSVRRLVPEEGVLSVEGKVCSLWYAEENGGSGAEKGFFARLFR